MITYSLAAPPLGLFRPPSCLASHSPRSNSSSRTARSGQIARAAHQALRPSAGGTATGHKRQQPGQKLLFALEALERGRHGTVQGILAASPCGPANRSISNLKYPGHTLSRSPFRSPRSNLETCLRGNSFYSVCATFKRYWILWSFRGQCRVPPRGGPLNGCSARRGPVVPGVRGALASAVRCRPCLLSCRTGNRRLNLPGGNAGEYPGTKSTRHTLCAPLSSITNASTGTRVLLCTGTRRLNPWLYTRIGSA